MVSVCTVFHVHVENNILARYIEEHIRNVKLIGTETFAIAKHFHSMELLGSLPGKWLIVYKNK